MERAVLFRFLVIIVVVVAAGCASTEQMRTLPENYYAQTSKDEIHVVMVGDLPSVNVVFPGAGCLLCMAAANTMHGQLKEHAATLDLLRLQQIGIEIVDGLTAKGLTASVSGDPSVLSGLGKFEGFSSKENFAKLDFRSLKERLSGDTLLLIEVNGAGFSRDFLDYFPTSDPVAYVNAQVSWINLDTNELIVKQVVRIKVASDREWKAPPAYPGLTEALYKAIADTKIAVLQLLGIPPVLDQEETATL